MLMGQLRMKCVKSAIFCLFFCLCVFQHISGQYKINETFWRSFCCCCFLQCHLTMTYGSLIFDFSVFTSFWRQSTITITVIIIYMYKNMDLKKNVVLPKTTRRHCYIIIYIYIQVRCIFIKCFFFIIKKRCIFY